MQRATAPDITNTQALTPGAPDPGLVAAPPATALSPLAIAKNGLLPTPGTALAPIPMSVRILEGLKTHFYFAPLCIVAPSITAYTLTHAGALAAAETATGLISIWTAISSWRGLRKRHQPAELYYYMPNTHGEALAGIIDEILLILASEKNEKRLKKTAAKMLPRFIFAIENLLGMPYHQIAGQRKHEDRYSDILWSLRA